MLWPKDVKVPRNPEEYRDLLLNGIEKVRQKKAKSSKIFWEDDRFIGVVYSHHGEPLHNVIHKKTGLAAFGNRKTKAEAIQDIKKLYIHAISDAEFNKRLKSEFEFVKQQLEIKKKYGEKTFRGARKMPGKKVLDLGPGISPDMRATHAVDIQTLRAMEASRFKDIKFKAKVDASKGLPYRTGFFDMVISYGALGHNFGAPKTYAEVYRILKPGGKLELGISAFIGESYVANITEALKKQPFKHIVLKRKVKLPSGGTFNVFTATK